MLYVRSKLDLGLDASELAGLVKRYGVWTVQDVISRLKFKKKTYHWLGRPVNSSKHIWWLEISLRHKNCTTVLQTDRQTVNFRESDGSDLHVKQIELDWVSGVYVLVRVEELASEQKGLVLVHPLLSERPAVVQPVHWQHTVQPQGLDYKKETILDINILFFVLQYSKVWFQRKEMIKKQWDKLSP